MNKFGDFLKTKSVKKEKLSILQEDNIELDLSIDDNSEKDLITSEIKDGYLGEMNYAPNPLEYGPNATYRNLKEGIIYKKNVDNLWEVYLKDGKTGTQGPRGFAGGSGIGRNECISILEQYGQMPFSMNKKENGELEMIQITVSAGQYLTSALPVGPSYLFQYTGIGPFTIKSGNELTSATVNDLPAFSGLREVLYIKDSHISLYGVGPGTVTIVGGVGV